MKNSSRLLRTRLTPIKNSILFIRLISQTNVDVYMQQLKTAQARIPCSSWPTIETVLNTAFESVLRGDATSQEALDAAAAQIDELLAKE